MNNQIRLLLKSPIAFHRVFAMVANSALSGLFLSQLYYWTEKTKGGWLYKSVEEWNEETGMTRREVDTARSQLKSLGILEEDRRGVPCRLYFRLNLSKLEQVIDSKSLAESAKLECTKAPNLFGGKRQTNTEITTETTTEKKHIVPSLENSSKEYLGIKREEIYKNYVESSLALLPRVTQEITGLFPEAETAPGATDSARTAHTPKKDRERLKTQLNDKLELPLWVPVSSWREYESMRKQIGAPLTDGAKKRAWVKLEELSGKDLKKADAILLQSVDNCWKGLFELHGNGNKQPPEPELVDALELKRRKEQERKNANR